MRQEFEMTEEDVKDLLASMQPVPYMVFGGVAPRSQQENANDAWMRLGSRMGFDGMTVEPSKRGPRFFTAVANAQPK